MNQNNPKKYEIETDITYLLCPDKKCKLFYDATRPIPCEDQCPKQKGLIKIIKCINCEELIELPGNHFIWGRIDHNCPDKRTAGNFRMSGKYVLIYERPK